MLQFPAKARQDTYFKISIYNIAGRTYKQVASVSQIKPEYSKVEDISLPLPTDGLVDNYQLRFEDAKTAAAEASVGAVAANVLKSVAQNVGVYDYASMVSGRAIDPNVTPLFRGIELRTLSVSFDLIPRSREDSQAASNIVKALRTAVLPAVEGGLANSVLSFPSAFDLSIVINGSANIATLPQLQSQDGNAYNWICEGMNVTYNGGAPWSNFINGEPTQITIQMNFKEMTKRVRGVIGNSGFADAIGGDPSVSAALAAEQTQTATGKGNPLGGTTAEQMIAEQEAGF